MDETTFTGLPLASGIDAAADWFAIDRTSLNTTQRISRNTVLGITGSPVGTTDTQELSNKTLGVTNTVTLYDSLLTIQDNSDPTRQAQFQASGITAGQTRTYTLPDGSTTLVGTGLTQTLTNKTLTSPTITGGSITGTTITTDAIVGQSVANSGTVYGLAVTTAKISGADITNATIPTAAIADSAVTPAKLLTGTGATWVWATWAPTLTNVSGGTLNYAKYIQIGKTVHFMLRYTLAGAGIAGLIGFSPPVNLSANYSSNTDTVISGGQLFDATGSRWSPWLRYGTSSRIDVLYVDGSSNMAATSSTAPFTWAASDIIMVSGTYEAA